MPRRILHWLVRCTKFRGVNHDQAVRRSFSPEPWAFGALLGTIFTIAFSIVLGQVFAAACGMCFVLAVRRRQTALVPSAMLVFAVLYILLAFVTSLHGGGTEGLWRRAGETLWLLLILPAASLCGTAERRMKVFWAFLGGVALLGLKNLVLNPVRAWRDPDLGFMAALVDKGSMTDGQMAMAGVVGSVAAMASFWRARRPVPAWFWGLLTFQVAALLINFKRGSWFCALILAGVMIATSVRWRTLLLLGVVLVGIVLLPPVHQRLGGLSREFKTDGGGRLSMWTRVTPALAAAHPAGVGYGCLTNEDMRKAFPKVERNRNHVHANWAQVLVELGWAGLVLHVAWMATLVAMGIQAWRRAELPLDRLTARLLLLTCGGLLLNGLVEYNLGDAEIIFLYAILMGLLSALRRSLNPAPAAPVTNP